MDYCTAVTRSDIHAVWNEWMSIAPRALKYGAVTAGCSRGELRQDLIAEVTFIHNLIKTTNTQEHRRNAGKIQPTIHCRERTKKQLKMGAIYR